MLRPLHIPLLRVGLKAPLPSAGLSALSVPGLQTGVSNGLISQEIDDILQILEYWKV